MTRRRWSIAARSATALLGGYVATSAAVALLARLLPVDRADATAWGMLSSFLFYALIGLWCFHERRLSRVAIVIWGGSIVSVLLLCWLGVRP